jgi:hypothetical protein
MSTNRRIVLGIAASGAAYCVYLLVGFVGVIANNRLPWEGTAFTRDHYLAVGQAYSNGFAVGFFLCFCLAVMAFVVGSWYEQRVREKAQVRPRATPSRSQGQAAVLPPA